MGERLNVACLDVELVFEEVDGSEGSDSGLVSFDCGNVVGAAGFQEVIDLLHSVCVVSVVKDTK